MSSDSLHILFYISCWQQHTADGKAAHCHSLHLFIQIKGDEGGGGVYQKADGSVRKKERNPLYKKSLVQYIYCIHDVKRCNVL